MDRKYKSGAVGAPPAHADNASDGYPTAGDPGAGTPATKPGPYWYHMITESLAQCILGAGLSLDKTVLTKLRDAVIILGGQGAWSTGDRKSTYKTVADPGWVMMDDGTIGNAASGGTTRANADTVALFTLLWNNTADAQCAVSGGRGANAAADFAANKTIALPKVLGRASSVAGAGSGLTSRALGLAIGAETKTLSVSETPSHHHLVTPAGTGGGGGGDYVQNSPGPHATGDRMSNVGGGGSFSLMQPAEFGNLMIKL